MFITVFLSFLISIGNPSTNLDDQKSSLDWSYVALDTFGVNGLNNAICPVMENGSIWYTQSDVSGKMHVLISNYNSCGVIGKNDVLSFKGSSKYIHLGPASIANERLFMAASTEQHSGLQIIELKKSNSKWKYKGRPSFTNLENNFTHPALSADGSALYFISDMPGTLGGTDIFKVTRKRNSWGEVQHLGEAVNSSKNELFPSTSKSGVLFFSSDKEGDLNIYQFSDGVIKKLPAPINSSADDFGITLDDNLVNGLFTSNRNGADKVYSFSRVNAELFGKIINSESKTPILGCKMNLNCGSKDFKVALSGSKYNVVLAPNNIYTIEVSHPDFEPFQIEKSTSELVNAEVEYLAIELTPKSE